MKRIALALAVLVSMNVLAQEGEIETTTTKKTVVKGADKKVMATKKQTTKATQKKMLIGDSNDTNFETVRLPWDVNQNVTYSFDKKRFTMKKMDNGYGMMKNEKGTNTMYARVMPSARNGYFIINKDNENSLGYLDKNGNLVVESYNPETDTMKVVTYTMEK